MFEFPMGEGGNGMAMTRRTVLGVLGAAGVAAVAGTPLAPRPAAAQALGQNESVEAALKRVFGGRPMRTVPA
jgi:hypothetical protein